MVRKKISIEEELKKIEQDERAIMAEERTIEQKEDLIRTFEELGLMRWKSYYVLTAGAILILALSFTLAFWTMNMHLEDMSTNLDSLDAQISSFKAPSAKDWCPTGETLVLAGGTADYPIPPLTSKVVGKVMLDGVEMCHTVVVTENPDGSETTMNVYVDESGKTTKIL